MRRFPDGCRLLCSSSHLAVRSNLCRLRELGGKLYQIFPKREIILNLSKMMDKERGISDSVHNSTPKVTQIGSAGYHPPQLQDQCDDSTLASNLQEDAYEIFELKPILGASSVTSLAAITTSLLITEAKGDNAQIEKIVENNCTKDVAQNIKNTTIIHAVLIWMTIITLTSYFYLWYEDQKTFPGATVIVSLGFASLVILAFVHPIPALNSAWLAIHEKYEFKTNFPVKIVTLVANYQMLIVICSNVALYLYAVILTAAKHYDKYKSQCKTSHDNEQFYFILTSTFSFYAKFTSSNLSFAIILGRTKLFWNDMKKMNFHVVVQREKYQIVSEKVIETSLSIISKK